MAIKHLRSGTRVVNTGGDEHSPVAVDDESTVIVGDVERLEVLAGYHCHVYGQRQDQTLE